MSVPPEPRYSFCPYLREYELKIADHDNKWAMAKVLPGFINYVDYDPEPEPGTTPPPEHSYEPPVTGIKYFDDKATEWDELTNEQRYALVNKTHHIQVEIDIKMEAFRTMVKYIQDEEKKAYNDLKNKYDAEMVQYEEAIRNLPTGRLFVRFLGKNVPRTRLPSKSINKGFTNIAPTITVPKHELDYLRMYPYVHQTRDTRKELALTKFKDFTHKLMAMQADQLINNHCHHRHMGIAVVKKAAFKDCNIIQSTNAFTVNMLATICMFYGQGSWDSTISNGQETIESFAQHSHGEYKISMEMVKHVAKHYGRLDNNNPFHHNITESALQEVNVRHFLDKMVKSVKKGIVSDSFLVENCFFADEPAHDEELQRDLGVSSDSEADDIDLEEGVEKKWVQGLYFPHAQILASITSRIRNIIDVEGGKTCQWMSDKERALLSDTPALYSVSKGIQREHKDTTNTDPANLPTKRSTQEFRSLVLPKTKKPKRSTGVHRTSGSSA